MPIHQEILEVHQQLTREALSQPMDCDIVREDIPKKNPRPKQDKGTDVELKVYVKAIVLETLQECDLIEKEQDQ